MSAEVRETELSGPAGTEVNLADLVRAAAVRGPQHP